MSTDVWATPETAPFDGAGPRNAIVVVLDSLNRHMLGCYGGTEFDTSNLDRLAARSIRFDQHHSASLPCMPARHDILCGAWDFLWKPWGSIELWEDAITVPLRMNGVATALVSDHPHLFERGGENYHCDFGSWQYERGHENDPWKLRPDPSWTGTPALHAERGWHGYSYDDNRTWFRSEDDFPGPKTMTAASRWLDENVGGHERFLLFIDEFDPHEPFDTPEPWAYRYHDQRDEDLLIWPPYARHAYREGGITHRQGEQIRANYGAKLSMIDHWFGKLLDRIDHHGLWDDTAVIVTTDHGHYLGEHDGAFGKPNLAIHNVLGHIPLLISWPGAKPGASGGLTTSVDLHATIADIFDVQSSHRTHGRSLRPIVDGNADAVRDWTLQGYYGREVNVIDARGKYVRGAPDGPGPISLWSNRWSTMPIKPFPNLNLPMPDDRAVLDRMPGSTIPVIRQPIDFVDPASARLGAQKVNRHHELFSVDDEDERENMAGSSLESEYEELLRHALDSIDAPSEHLTRLGLSP
jgi:arylsulfatase A-like enzyme